MPVGQACLQEHAVVRRRRLEAGVDLVGVARTHAVGHLAAHVHLGERRGEPEVGEGVQHFAHLEGVVVAVLGAKVPLAAYAVDGDAARAQLPGHGVDVPGLVGGAAVAERLDVVVVVEQQGAGVGGAGPAEGVGDVAGAEVLGPEAFQVDRRRAVPRVAGRLVDDVPLPDLALEVLDDGSDVVAQDVAQLRVADRPVVDALGEPGGQLVLPDQHMTADLLLVPAGEVDQLVGRTPLVHAPGGFERLPLHDVLGGDGGELRRGERPVLRIGRVAQRVHVDRGADGELVTGGERAQALLGDRGVPLSRENRHGGQRAGQREHGGADGEETSH